MVKRFALLIIASCLMCYASGCSEKTSVDTSDQEQAGDNDVGNGDGNGGNGDGNDGNGDGNGGNGDGNDGNGDGNDGNGDGNGGNGDGNDGNGDGNSGNGDGNSGNGDGNGGNGDGNVGNGDGNGGNGDGNDGNGDGNSGNGNGNAGDDTPCENDSWRCSDKELQKCVEGAWAKQAQCKSAAHCNLAEHSCDPCDDGNWQCAGPVLEKCVNRKWTTDKTCDTSSQCNEKRMQCDECVVSTWQCKGAELQKCISGQWTKQESCASESFCNAEMKKCNACNDTDAASCSENRYQACINGQVITKECSDGCEGNICKGDQCPNHPTKTAPGVCGCDFDDVDVDKDGTVDCPVLTIPGDALPELPEIEGECAEWKYPRHPVIQLPDLPKYSYETTIDLAKYGITSGYDVSKAKANSEGLTQAIKDAKLAGYTRIRIPDGHYAVENAGVKLVDDMALIMSEKVTLQMVPIDRYDCTVLAMSGLSNVYVEGGTLIGDKDTHLGPANQEECGGLTIFNANHLFLNGTKIKDVHGDGILLLDYDKDTPDHTTHNIIFANCEIDSAYRNGIALVGVDGLRISNCEIHHTKGTAPQFAIDFEANGRSDRNRSIILDNNKFHDNVAGDLIIDSYDTFIENNRFEQGAQERYIDNAFIPRSYSSFIFYKNYVEMTRSTGCGAQFACSYGKNQPFEIPPSFIVDNELNVPRTQFTYRDRLCIKGNNVYRSWREDGSDTEHVDNSMMSASGVTRIRLIDNTVSTLKNIKLGYAFKNITGTGSGNKVCTHEPPECKEEERINSMSDDELFTMNGQTY